MGRSQSGDEIEYALGERYRRQYDGNRRAHLRDSSHEAAQWRRDSARRRRFARYFLIVLIVFALGSLAALAAFWNELAIGLA